MLFIFVSWSLAAVVVDLGKWVCVVSLWGAGLGCDSHKPLPPLESGGRVTVPPPSPGPLHSQPWGPWVNPQTCVGTGSPSPWKYA